MQHREGKPFVQSFSGETTKRFTETQFSGCEPDSKAFLAAA